MAAEPLSEAPARPGRSWWRPRAMLIGWATLVFLLSVLPLPQGPKLPFKFLAPDTIAHICFYIPLGALFFWSFPAASKHIWWLRGAGLTFAFGAAIEVIQAIIPYRSFEFTDGLADLIGGSVGAAAALVITRALKPALGPKDP